MPDKPNMPLARFKVLDLTRVRAGPTAVRQLADWGAQVIKIEAPPSPGEGLGGPRLGPDFQNLHRNKRSLTLDLKAPDGIEIFRKLVRDADVVVENFRPDVKERLGIGNNYVNRNMIGAVVGVQPFGGERLSGTGPKAGGPRYLHRFATERSVSIDTTASGGNAGLLSLDDGR